MSASHAFGRMLVNRFTGPFWPQYTPENEVRTCLSSFVSLVNVVPGALATEWRQYDCHSG